MAKSKIIKANEKIAEKVTTGFQKLTDTVVGGYTEIEDKFVDQYLTKDGETIEEAKERLHSEQNARKELQAKRKEQHTEKLKERRAMQAEHKADIKNKH